MAMVTLETALDSGLIRYGDKVDLSSCLPENHHEVVLKGNLTGTEKDQVVARENLVWTLSESYQGIPFLISEVTDFSLTLHGVLGSIHYRKVFETVASLYGNHDLGLIAHVLSVNDYYQLSDKNFKKSSKGFWLDEQFYNISWGIEWGLVAYSQQVDFFQVFTSQYLRKMDEYTRSRHLVFMVFLVRCHRLMVDLSKTKDGYYRLFPATSK